MKTESTMSTEVQSEQAFPAIPTAQILTEHDTNIKTVPSINNYKDFFQQYETISIKSVSRIKYNQ